MLAYGWGTVYKDVTISTFDRRSLVPMMFVIVSHALIALLMFFDHEERHKFHEYQGTQGLSLCLFRVFFLFVFLVMKRSTSRKVSRDIS
jgi:hypothetical protein